MVRLHLLGSQRLEVEGKGSLDAVVAQPKRFALLSYLALAAGQYVRRDTLLAIFWPELDQFAARRALRNTLYQLRRAIGTDVFRTRGDEEIAVDADACWCDVTALSSAVDAGRYDEAAALYHGELLRGFHLPEGDEAFERWLLAERERALSHILRALRTLAERDAQAGQALAAARWAARAREIAPYDEEWLRRTMALLSAAGDSGGALRAYEAFARQFREDMGSDPSAETTQLAARLRAEQSTRIVVPPAPALDPAPPSPQAPAAPARSASIRWVVAALVLIGAILGVAVRRRERTQRDVHRIVVSVFRNRTGDPRLESVGDMAADWVTRGLFATGIGEVIDPDVLMVRGRGADGRPTDPLALARVTGAGTVVEGQYYKSGDTLLFVVSIADAHSGKITGQVGPVTVPISRPASALDLVRSRVMTALAIALDPRFAERATHGVEPPPFPAYDAYVRGWDAFWLGDPSRAEQLFREAGRVDSTFAQAAVALSTAAANAEHCGVVDSVTRAWPSERLGLTEVDRLTLAIAVAHCRGDVEERLRLSLARARLVPRSSSSRLAAANAALWADRPAQALAMLHGVDPAIDLAWMPDSTHYGFFDAQAEANHRLGRYADELESADRIRGLVPLGGTWLRARALVGLGRSRDALRMVDVLLSLPADPKAYWGLVAATEGRPEYSATGGWAAAWIAREFLAHGDSVDGRAVAVRALAWAEHRSAAEREMPESRFLVAVARDLAGNYAGAEQWLAAMLVVDSGNVDVHGLLAGAAAAVGDTAVAHAGDRWLARLDAGQAGWAAPLYRARIAIREGRIADAIGLLRAARAAGAWPLWMHCDPAVFPLHASADYARLMGPKG